MTFSLQFTYPHSSRQPRPNILTNRKYLTSHIFVNVAQIRSEGKIECDDSNEKCSYTNESGNIHEETWIERFFSPFAALLQKHTKKMREEVYACFLVCGCEFLYTSSFTTRSNSHGISTMRMLAISYFISRVSENNKSLVFNQNIVAEAVKKIHCRQVWIFESAFNVLVCFNHDLIIFFFQSSKFSTLLLMSLTFCFYYRCELWVKDKCFIPHRFF